MKVLYVMWQVTWGCLQSLAGLLVLCANANAKHWMFRGCIVTEWKQRTGLSLGLFIFIPAQCRSEEWRKNLLLHEYGHTIQSLLLGPLYLLAVGIPSFVWASVPAVGRKWRSGEVSYYSVYPENWANRLGERWGKKGMSDGI